MLNSLVRSGYEMGLAGGSFCLFDILLVFKADDPLQSTSLNFPVEPLLMQFP